MMDSVSVVLDTGGKQHTAKASGITSTENKVSFIALGNYSSSAYDDRKSYKENISHLSEKALRSFDLIIDFRCVP